MNKLHLINNLDVARDSTIVSHHEDIKTSYREEINGTIYVREKTIPLSEHIDSATDFRKFELDALRSAGVNPQMVNPTIIKPQSSEHQYADNDDILQSSMDNIENMLETSETSSPPIENNPPITENSENS